MGFPIRIGWRTAAGLALLLAGCTAEPTVDLVPQSVPPDKTVVTVNGEPLSTEEFDERIPPDANPLQRRSPRAICAPHQAAAVRGSVINRRILVQEARKAGIKMTQAEVDGAFQEALKDVPEDFWAVLKERGISPDIWKRKMLQEKMARKVVDLEVNSKVQITPQEVEDYYSSHLSKYWRPRAVRARHLVVQRRGDLQKVLESLKKSGDFPKITSTFSVGPERSQGGDWGFMDTDRLPAEYLKALSGLKPGEISKPLKDNFGYHLFQLIEWRNRQMRPFAEVKDQIHDDLTKEEQDLRFDQWMTDLKKKSTIKVNKDLAPIIGVTLEDLSE